MVIRFKQAMPVILSATLFVGLLGCDGGGESEVAEVQPAAATGDVQPASLTDADTAADDGGLPMATAQTEPTPEYINRYGAGNTPGSPSKAGSADDRPDSTPKTKPEKVPGDDRFGPAVVKANPVKVVLGEIPTNDSKTGTVSLINTGTEPRKILECKTSCGCTTVNCPKNKILAPGESVALEVKLNGGPQPRTLNKTVTFLVENHPPIQVPVSGESINYVTLDPERLDPEEMPEGRVTLRAIDEKPFVIKSMYPALVKEFETEPSVEHTVYLPWDLWEDLGQSRKLIFNLDHPTSRQLYAYVTVKNPLKNQPQRTPNQPAPAVAGQPDILPMLEGGKTAEIIALVQADDFNVNRINSSGYTPLLTAAHFGSLEVVEVLLDASADIEATDRVGRTSLMFAVQQDNLAVVQALVDAGADVEALDTIGNSALCWAAGFGKADAVKLLLDLGAGVDVAGLMTGFTPAIWAAGYGEAESLQALVDSGADVNAEDTVQGATPLIHAVRTGRVDNIEVLLAAGADIDYADKNGVTAILHAAGNSGAGVDTVQALIDAGADYTARSDSGDSAIDIVKKRTDDKAPAVKALLVELLGETTD
jgi:ankyrin repeat protein